MGRRWVAHIDMDAFFASVEQLTRPTLRGRPVLVGGVSGRGVVAGASYEARAYGARSAMPMHQAITLCRRRAVVVRPRSEIYKLASEKIFDVLRDKAGVVEQLSVDEGFATAETDDPEGWAQELRRAVEEATGLSSSVGMAATKLDAKMASDLAKPHGVCVIEHDRRMKVFGPRPVSDIWGIGRVAQGKLHDVGVDTIAQFVAMDPKDVQALLGNVGVEVHTMAAGHDPREVAPRGPAKQISAEHTLERDVTSTEALLPFLQRAAEGAHRRLLKDGRAARTVTVKTRTADFQIHTRSATLAAPTDELDVIVSTARRVLLRPEESGAVRLVGVGLSGLSHDRQQVLFPELDRTEDRPAPRVEVVHEEAPEPLAIGGWYPTQDVRHDTWGHGWVQGTGLDVVTVRFETRTTGPGFTKTMKVDDPALHPASPVDSLDW
ncbi:DNA polymerase IV [Corynebacterium sp. zg254]|uniref:DNA polymerase IV n=2 Tax=Corynebacteriaceae TaxID=1653 RepID=A0ABQ6VD04_9CORY|nr:MULTISPECIES: DNA polymerase IV [Corynebacterium]KAB3520807.1 DNA polymerase IV [Corynebacterium zhongnanshanii]MCR5914425.1 DNA polymerase IV [Corynebacterium sp. zg254]